MTNTEDRKVTHTRHYNARVHETWFARVPEHMLTDPTWFDEDGNPTADFDQWVCDNGEIGHQDYESLDERELAFESEVAATLAEQAKTAIDEGRFTDAAELLAQMRDV